MHVFLRKLRDEPAMVVAAIVAVLALFGVNVTDNNADLITQVLAVLVPLVGGAVTRQQVTPTVRADAAREQAALDAYRQIEAND